MRDGWRRVTREKPCPVCGHDSWCCVSDRTILCMRAESPKPSRGVAGGWLHPVAGAELRETDPRPRRERPTIDAAAIHRRCRADCTAGHVERLSNQLGLSQSALMVYGLGWHAEKQVYTFPMYDGADRVVGIRTRTLDGKKRCIAGSRNGVFLGCTHNTRCTAPIFLPEGPTDAAALWQLGLNAIGRPQCRGGTREIISLLPSPWRPLLVVVADRDKPDALGRLAGIEGAESDARRLRAAGFIVYVIQPPPGIKDCRDWLQSCAKSADIYAEVGRCSI